MSQRAAACLWAFVGQDPAGHCYRTLLLLRVATKRICDPSGILEMVENLAGAPSSGVHQSMPSISPVAALSLLILAFQERNEPAFGVDPLLVKYLQTVVPRSRRCQSPAGCYKRSALTSFPDKKPGASSRCRAIAIGRHVVGDDGKGPGSASSCTKENIQSGEGMGCLEPSA